MRIEGRMHTDCIKFSSCSTPKKNNSCPIECNDYDVRIVVRENHNEKKSKANYVLGERVKIKILTSKDAKFIKKLNPELKTRLIKERLSGAKTVVLQVGQYLDAYLVADGPTEVLLSGDMISRSCDPLTNYAGNPKLIVDKEEFVRCIEYIRKINNTPLKQLDLSDFGSEKEVAAVVKKFKYCGLSNRDAILDLLGENRVTIITATKEKK